MHIKFKVATLAAVVAAIVAPITATAAPKATLYGGGATFPATAYAGPSWLTGNPPGVIGNPAPVPSLRLSNPADAKSLFGQYSLSTAATQGTAVGFFPGTTTRPLVSYCQTGSGGGKNVLTGGAAGTTYASGLVGSATEGENSCGTYAATQIGGFGAPGTAVEPDFAGTDSPITQSEYNTYITNKSSTRVEPVQMPSVAGAVAVIYNNPQTGTLISGTPINLTESQVCQIWSGAINNWVQLGYPSKAIKLVYRSDSSGTSFGFSNHLSAVCPTAQPTGVSGFSTQQNFNAAFPSGIIPAGAIGAPGNGSIVSTVFATDGAIGFADIADATNRASIDPATPKIQYTTISLKPGVNPLTLKPYLKKSPLKLSKKFKIATGGVVADKVIGPNVNGRPTLLDINPVPVGPGCVLVANPDSYATAPISATTGDYTSYPIMAVSYLLAHRSGNGDDTQNIQALLASVYGAPTLTNIMGTTTTIAPTKGFAYLTGFPNPTKTIKACVLP